MQKLEAAIRIHNWCDFSVSFFTFPFLFRFLPEDDEERRKDQEEIRLSCEHTEQWRVWQQE